MSQILTSLATLPGEKPHVRYPKQYLPLSSSRRSQMPPCFPSENPYTVWVNLVKVASLICESDPDAPRWGTSEGPAAYSNDFALCREIIPAGRGDCCDTRASADGSHHHVPSQMARLHIPVFRNLFFGSKKMFLTGFLGIFFSCVFRRNFS